MTAVSSSGRLLIVDDEVELMTALCETLGEQGYETHGYASAKDALEALNELDFDVLLADLMMPQMDGITLLRAGLEIDPYLGGIIMTGQGTVQTAVEAMKVGAFDYVLKPFKLNSLLPILSRAMEVRRLKTENLHLQETVAIYELSRALAFTLDSKTILHKVADATIQQPQVDEVSIMLPAESGAELYIGVVRGENRSHILGMRVPIDDGIAGWVAAHGEAVTIRGPVNDPRFALVKPRESIGSSISMPMLADSKLVGVLNVNATRARRPFTVGQIKAVSILASIAASALENAQLYSEVRNAEEMFRTLAESIPAPTYIYRGDHYVYANTAAELMTGYSREELCSMTIWDVIHPDFQEMVKQYSHARQRGEAAPSQYEIKIVTKAGEERWSAITATVMSFQGEPSVLITSFDITERKRAEEALRKSEEAVRASEERYRELFENANDIIYTCDLEGRFTSLNKTGEVIAGYSRDEALNMSIADLAVPEDIEIARTMLRQNVADGAPATCELTIKTKGGRRVSLEVSTRLIYHQGRPVGVQGIARNVTERKHLEDQLRQSQKMEAIGRLAGGVAHDFNNLLTAIIGYNSLALARVAESDPMRKELEEVRNAGSRAASLTNQLLAFSRKQALQPKVLDLNAAIKNLNRMLRRIIGEDVELATELDPSLGPVRADPGQIEQVILNLAINARDAMPEGGKLTIATFGFRAGDWHAQPHPGLQAGPYVGLDVTDTGCGMDEETLSRIFEPFFTTKSQGKGTGLGLSTVYGIISQSGGRISVRSEPGKGAAFRICLPQAEAAADFEALQTGPELLPEGTETVLLVEDDKFVRELAGAVLEQQGYTVLAASDPMEAIHLAQTRGRQVIHLLLTDVVMPQMNGRELAQRLSKVCPGMKVIYASGYVDAAPIQHGGSDRSEPFLQKPFTPGVLARKVREVLDETPAKEKHSVSESGAGN